jgi:hemerythrin-like domain-containing protein
MSLENPDPSTKPFDDFSQCHAGIVRKLDLLGELPALLEPAGRAVLIAQKALEFFSEAIFEHHLDEERELFPVVVAHSVQGSEAQRVQAMVQRLTQEHRELEQGWKKVAPGLKRAAKGHFDDVSATDISTLVIQYKAHARFEEAEFLPLAQGILARNANHLAALGMSLHMRHAQVDLPGYI